MNLLDTTEIPGFPKQVFIGWSPIKFDLNPAILSAQEQKNIEGFTNEKRTAEYLTARHLFWKMLKELNWEMNGVSIEKENLGKPFINTATGRRFVSFSHSPDMVLCAVSSHLDIGLDAELLDRKVNPQIVKRILSENEWKVYSEDDPIELWTMKEASVKSLGTGLRTNLKELELQKFEHGAFRIKLNHENELQGISFKALNHHIAIAY